MRHRIFVQQCKSLVQVVDWISHDLVRVDAEVGVHTEQPGAWNLIVKVRGSAPMAALDVT